MPSHLPIIILGAAMVATRAVRQRVLRSTIQALSRGEKPRRLGLETVEVAGKAEKLPVQAPSLKAAFTIAPLLIRLEATDKGAGKVPVFELTTGWRRRRWLFSAKARGPLLDISIVPSPAGIANLATIVCLIAVGALIFQPNPYYIAVVAALLGIEAWRLLRIPSVQIKRELETMLAVEG